MSEQTLQLKPVAKPKRVVVLGSRGFVGSKLCKELHVAGIPFVGVSSQEIDLLRPESVEQLQKMLRADDHLVVVSALTPDKGRDAATLMKNLQMILNIIEAVSKQACSHILSIGSDAVYTEKSSLVSETTPCDPASFHGLMHSAREKILQEATTRLKIPFCSMRPCAIYGPGDTHNSYGPNRFIRTALAEKKITLGGGGEEKRDHLFIQDFVRMVLTCLQHSAIGVINAASGQAVSFREVADIVNELLDGTIDIQTTPRQSAITHRHFDVANILSAFPELEITPLREGLKQSIPEFRNL